MVRMLHTKSASWRRQTIGVQFSVPVYCFRFSLTEVVSSSERFFSYLEDWLSRSRVNSNLELSISSSAKLDRKLLLKPRIKWHGNPTQVGRLEPSYRSSRHRRSTPLTRSMNGNHQWHLCTSTALYMLQSTAVSSVIQCRSSRIRSCA